MDFNNDQGQDMAFTASDPQRPPHYNPHNVSSGGYGQLYSGDEGDTDADRRHEEHAQTLLHRLMQEHAMTCDDTSDDEMSSSDGDEGLEDHQRSQHVDNADFGYSHVRHIANHHHRCDCSICPYRNKALVTEWLLMNAVADPETPGSMYPEQSSGELSMVSSMFFETRPQSPVQLLAEIGSCLAEGSYNYIPSPLPLLPERLLPHQLETCIPEEEEPTSDDEY